MRKSGALGLLQDVFWAVQTITTHSKKRVGVCVGDVMAPLHARRGQLKRVWPTHWKSVRTPPAMRMQSFAWLPGSCCSAQYTCSTCAE